MRILLAVAGWLVCLPAMALSMAFINPGKSDEVYWVTAAHAMESAARDLGVKLEVLYAERQHPRVLDFARQIIARPRQERPDFVIFSNDYATGPELLRLFDAAGIKTFMAFSGISDPLDRKNTGQPRQHYKTWLGSIEPHAEEAGYLTAKALISKGREAGAMAADGKLHLLAISGDRSTPTSIRRGEGMRKAVSEAPDVVLDQEIFAAWNREKAAEQAEWLLQRYPAARLVWAGNDLMAFGAMQALEKRGGRVGRDVWFSGVNTSREAMEAVKSGRLTALSGGHFIAGAWAVVMLYDYANGRDFAGKDGLELDQSMFALFSRAEAETFLNRYGEMNFDAVDFRRFSKVLNHRVKRYDFSFRQLLN